MSNLIDLKGKRFGKLVAQRFLGRGKMRSKWLCICDCGKELSVSVGHLRSGHTKSCGCSRFDITENLLGRVFEYLTVIGRSVDKRNKTIWKCKCICGKELFTQGTALTHKRIFSCGCWRKRDLTGLKFGKLFVLDLAEEGIGKRTWNCVCECGSYRTIATGSLVSGNSKSCGCVAIEKTIKRCTTHGFSREKNRHPLHHIWSGMKSRCFNKKSNSYKHYGSRGITVDERWLEFKNFLDDMGPSYISHKKEHHNPLKQRTTTLERKDNNGNYSKENCRWATQKEQCNNKRDNHFITVDGEKLSLTQVAEKYGVDYDKLKAKIKKGISPKEAIKMA